MYGWSGFGDLPSTSSGIKKSLVLFRYDTSFHRLLDVGFILIGVFKAAVHETHSNTINPRIALLVVLEVVVPTGGQNRSTSRKCQRTTIEHSVKHYVRLVGRVADRTVLLIGLLESATGSLPVLVDVV